MDRAVDSTSSGRGWSISVRTWCPKKMFARMALSGHDSFATSYETTIHQMPVTPREAKGFRHFDKSIRWAAQITVDQPKLFFVTEQHLETPVLVFHQYFASFLPPISCGFLLWRSNCMKLTKRCRVCVCVCLFLQHWICVCNWILHVFAQSKKMDPSFSPDRRGRVWFPIGVGRSEAYRCWNLFRKANRTQFPE